MILIIVTLCDYKSALTMEVSQLKANGKVHVRAMFDPSSVISNYHLVLCKHLTTSHTAARR